MAIFVARLFYLQIIKHDEYTAQAAAEQVKPLTIPAKRGLVYAMDGENPVQIVMNQTVYTLFVDPATVSQPEKVKEVVRRVAGGNLRPNIDSLIGRKDTRYQILGTKLTRQQAELIKKEELAGVGFQETTQRVYPEGSLAAQTLGFVNAEGVGQYGIEGTLNDRLTGHDGLLKSVTDVSGVPLTLGNQNINKPARNGENIVLSIDRNIQAYAEKALAKGLQDTGAQKGSVIVMNPQNGQVMAMANLPSYKPAEFTQVTDASVFNNAAVAVPYEAGSVIKTLTVATGLDKGVIQPDSTYVNTDKIKVADREIGNATKGQTGTITMQHALDYSLNTGMVTIAQRLGDGTINQAARDSMYQYFHDRFGMGQPTGIELLGEAVGNLPNPSAPGAGVQYATMSFGQGMNVTMTQVISAFCSAINGGTYYRPTVIAGTMINNDQFQKTEPDILRREVVTKQTSDTLRTMVYNARHKFHGSKDRPGYEVGGKTGTSQTIINGRYVDEQTIGSYLGYGASEGTAKYVIMVQVSGENMNLEGGKHAMPIFTDISNWLIDYLKLQPRK
jgi:cell division protein FtsI (penicillin-binding protein 3)